MKEYTPLEYIKIDIANQFGLDKEQFETRIDWVDANDIDLESKVKKADDRFRYAAAVMALREVQAGKPTGHLVGLDACASGPQIMSAFMCDKIGAKNTGLIGSQRMDIYTETTKTMNNLLPNNIAFDRKIVKQALMP